MLLLRLRFLSSAASSTHVLPYTSAKLAGFTAPTAPNHLHSAVERGTVSVQAKGKSFGSDSLRMTMMNLSEEAVSVQVPRGTFFANAEPWHQPLIVSEDYEFHIPSDGSLDVSLNAFCGHSGLACPADDSMSVMPHVLTVPGVLCSQMVLWQWLDLFESAVPATCAPDVPARQYYEDNSNEFADFDARCVGQSDSSAPSAVTAAAMPRHADSDEGDSSWWWPWSSSSSQDELENSNEHSADTSSDLLSWDDSDDDDDGGGY